MPKMKQREIDKYLMDMPDEVLSSLKFSMPWQYGSGTTRDEDGFPVVKKTSRGEDSYTQKTMQAECFRRFQKNPHINTSVRGLVGRMTGLGFETTSENYEIQQAIEEIEYDPRNRLYHFWPKYVGRLHIEGELFLILTCHADGFIEVDFLDPIMLAPDGFDSTGIIFHPEKTLMPLFYVIETDGGKKRLIPSIFIARYPELASVLTKEQGFSAKNAAKSRSRKRIFRKFGKYNQFIVSLDKGLVTRRAISYLRTTIEWINHYENLKKYEIDHKKSAGAYLWVFTIEDSKAFKTWLSMSKTDKRKTGILSKKTPGGTLILPPGIKLDVRNPSLTSIKEQDTDILQMVASGLNEPDDVLTGTNKGTYASVKASRGPMSDRTSDEIAYFDRWLKHDFWGSIFFLKSTMGKFPPYFKVKEAVGFGKDKKPIFRNVKKNPEMLIETSYPTSETVDFEGRARGLLGVKHGPVAEQAGIPNSEVAKRLGFGGYGRQRLKKATEDEKYPELVYEMGVDAEQTQEKAEGEQPKKKEETKKQPKKKEE